MPRTSSADGQTFLDGEAYGIYDFLNRNKTRVDWPLIPVRVMKASAADAPDRYREASPISHADAPHPPVLLMSGGKDRIVYAEYSRTLYEHLRRSGTAVLLVIPWANHAFDEVPFGPSAQLEMYYAGRFLAWAFR